MTTEQLNTSVRTEVLVEAPIARAFEAFTMEMAGWWPPEHHILATELAEMVLEPYAGGRIVDRGVDGSECCWAHVLVYDAPDRFAFSWDIRPDWTIEDDPSKRSEVDVRFIAEGPDRTRVELEHRELQRHGDGWEPLREAVGGADGWPVGLGRFAAFISG
jgi:uncharacterized protein YndB with AHSA1/START domain